MNSIAELYNLKKQGVIKSFNTMQSIRELKKEMSQGASFVCYPDREIDFIDIESYNSRHKTLIVRVPAWGGFVKVKLRNIRKVNI